MNEKVMLTGRENVMRDYVYLIFKSGMLLDEHDELLRQFWTPISAEKTNNFLLMLSTCAISCISLIQKRYVLFSVTALPIGFRYVRNCYRYFKNRSYVKVFCDLIITLKAQFQLNKYIINYCHKRLRSKFDSSNDTRQRIEEILSTKIDHFLNHVSNILLEMIRFLLETLTSVSEIVNIGQLNTVFHFDTNKIPGVLANLKDSIAMFEKVHLLYVLVTSQFLCGIGLSLCFKEWESLPRRLPDVFDRIIPELLNNIETCYDEIKVGFEDICSELTPASFEKTDKIVLSDKLTSTSLGTFMINMQKTFECARAIKLLLAENSTKGNKHLLENYKELEELFAECVESMKYLQYNVVKETGIKTEPLKPPTNSNNSQTERETAITVKHDDADECIEDEEFTLSIHGSDSSFEDEDAPTKDDYNQLRERIKAQKVLISELNNELNRRKLISQSSQPSDSKSVGLGHPEVKEQQVPETIHFTVPPPPPPMQSLSMVHVRVTL